jgi:hypothetical protein
VDDGVDHGLDNMDMGRVPNILLFTECEEEFSKQLHSNVDKRLMETRNKIPNYRPLFKTNEEALEIIALLTAWDETGKGKRKCVHHTRHEYRIWNKYEIIKAKGAHALHHRDTGLCVAICKDMFGIILEAHVGMGLAISLYDFL